MGDSKDIFGWDSRWIPCDHGLKKPLFQNSNPYLKIKDLLNDIKSWNLSLISASFNNIKDVEDITIFYI